MQLPYSIMEEKENIKILLKASSKLVFIDVLQSCKDRYHLIYTFMAILELLAEQTVKLTLGIGFNNFWISTNE
jgi:segregation and condensation protein A